MICPVPSRDTFVRCSSGHAAGATGHGEVRFGHRTCSHPDARRHRAMKHRVALTALLGAIGVLVASAGAAAAPTAPIHPGVQTLTNGGQCTSNFIFRDATSTYVGQAAHCSGTGAATSTNGCTSGSLPLGTPVTVTGASRPGTLVYNSWLTMQA